MKRISKCEHVRDRLWLYKEKANLLGYQFFSKYICKFNTILIKNPVKSINSSTKFKETYSKRKQNLKSNFWKR